MNASDLPSFSDDQEMAFWIHSVLADYHDGTATPKDIELLRLLLLENSAARQSYLEWNQLSCLLELTALKSTESVEKKEQAQPRKSLMLWVISGIAAALAAGAWLFMNHDLVEVDGDPMVATLSSSHEAVWLKGERVQGAGIVQERLDLRSGIAEIEFGNGASFVIEGPCVLEILDETSIRLISGKLWGHCPPAARGFEVLTPSHHRIIDQGTEFGVSVAAGGAVDVHVFDGEVDVIPSGKERQMLEAGGGVRVGVNMVSQSIKADSTGFKNSSDLQRERWRVHRESMLKRDDLLLYYDFYDDLKRNGTLLDHSGEGNEGQVMGALAVKGRLADKSALLFEDPKDAVALDLDQQPLGKGFTVAMWAKPDQFVHSASTLLNSNGYGSGGIHFQARAKKFLHASIRGIGNFGSDPGTIKAGEWQFFVMSWNLEARSVQLFCDGKSLKVRERPFASDPEAVAHFGECQIGSWGKPTYGNHRDFVGRIDEVMIFSRALDADEVAALYESSKP